MRCPLQYYFERILKLRRPFLASGLALGSAVHEGLAEYHRRLQAGEKTDVATIHDVVRTAWTNREAEAAIQYRDGEDRQEVVAQGIALLETYMAEPPPQNIVAVEKEMVVPLQTSDGEFLDKPLVAVVDLLNREPNGLAVTEFKTSGRRFHEFEADTTLQATCYAHAVQQRYGESAAVKYTVLVKTKKPSVQHLETARADSDMGRLGDTVAAIERAIAAQVFFPIESPLNCSGCPFRTQCRDWTGMNYPGERDDSPYETSVDCEVARC
jgi:CRISPR/Cas system-associated exonuclease Cas4 (RecB family)